MIVTFVISEPDSLERDTSLGDTSWDLTAQLVEKHRDRCSVHDKSSSYLVQVHVQSLSRDHWVVWAHYEVLNPLSLH